MQEESKLALIWEWTRAIESQRYEEALEVLGKAGHLQREHPSEEILWQALTEHTGTEMLRACDTPAPSEAPSCSFCGATRQEVSALIAGPNVYICERCVGTCAQVIQTRSEGETKED